MPHSRADILGRGVRLFAAWVFGLAPASVAVAGPSPGAPPSYGFNFAAISHPGNAAASVNHFGQPINVGRVDYAYRMATTEVTNAQWVNFLNVYVPLAFPGVAVSDFQITGAFNEFAGFNQQGNAQYAVPASHANRPVNFIGWRYAARFVNYLHNGMKPQGDATAADFENGAYDASTFGTAPYPGVPGLEYLTDQQRRSEGALYWIPSFDEWVKAAHWDPNKYGPDQPGYWQYPITSDTAPIPDDPALGGQTNTGPFPPGHTRPLDAGSYPGAHSPWGLLDLSGGVREWLEDTSVGGHIEFPSSRREAGSAASDSFPTANSDVLQYSRVALIGGHPSRGLRIASAIPSSGGVSVVWIVALGWLPRRRRSHDPLPKSLAQPPPGRRLAYRE